MIGLKKTSPGFSNKTLSSVTFVLLAMLAVAYAYYSFLLRNSRILFLIALFIGLIGCVALVLLDRMSKTGVAFEKRFIMLFVAAGFSFLIIFAPMKAPDEQSHFAAAYRYASFLLGEDAFGDRFMLREDDREELRYWWIDHRKLSDDYHAVAERFSLFADETHLSEYEGNPSYVSFSLNSRPPQLHIIPAIGIALSRLLGLGAIPLIYVGRIFAFLSFSGLAYFAVKHAPFGKMPMAALFLSPLVLQLATSYSYDAPIIALSMLFASLCMESISREGGISRWEIGRLMILAALLAPCKIVYVFVSVMVLFIPRERFKDYRKKIMGCIAVWGSALILLAIVSLPSLAGALSNSSTVSLPQHNSSGAPTDPDYMPSMYLSDALADPVHAIGMGFNTALKGSDIHIDGFFGGLMAWGQDMQGPRYIVLGFFLLAFLALFSGNPVPKIKPAHRLISLGMFTFSMVAIYASMLTGWTAQGSDSILGIQGRYFYPLWPLIIMMLYGLPKKIVHICPDGLLLPYCYLLFLYAGWIFNTIALM